jgi:hypothetical protein
MRTNLKALPYRRVRGKLQIGCFGWKDTEPSCRRIPMRSALPSLIYGGRGAGVLIWAPWMAAFAFGLIHGFGFATALNVELISGWPYPIRAALEPCYILSSGTCEQTPRSTRRSASKLCS